jgi:hypothetical protein
MDVGILQRGVQSDVDPDARSAPHSQRSLASMSTCLACGEACGAAALSARSNRPALAKNSAPPGLR